MEAAGRLYRLLMFESATDGSVSEKGRVLGSGALAGEGRFKGGGREAAGGAWPDVGSVAALSDKVFDRGGGDWGVARFVEDWFGG